MNSNDNLETKICSRCKLPFNPEDWEDTMCRECQGEISMERHQESMME